jgi:fumarate hydratase class II
MTREVRIEHDSLGDVEVPADALWQAQTQRAIANFPISGTTVSPDLVRALAELKAAAAIANAERGIVAADVSAAIVEVAREIAAGEFADQFPVDVFQTGSGTSTNMNMNEVVATMATRRLGATVHPNDHVNASQSSNDTFPSAIRIATARSLTEVLRPALAHLAAALRRKQAEFAHVVKAGRTHLMDAVPVTLGQEFGGYARAMELGIERIDAVLPRVLELPLGGTAVGTGLNAPPGFAADVIAAVAERTGLPFVEATDHFEAQGAQDALVEASGVTRVVAVSFNKLAMDLRLMASGPTAGLGEIHLPDLQPGSSIMPGKVNPVLPEAAHQVVAQVFGNDSAVAFAGSMGVFELNTMLPVIARNLLESIRLLASVGTVLADRCIDGIVADEEMCLRHALSSPALATALNPVIGYEAAARIVKRAVAERRTIRAVLQEEGLVDAATLDAVLDVRAMTEGGRLGG